MLLLNFFHPLTEEQQSAIETATSQTLESVLEIPTRFDHQRSFVEQAVELVDSIPLSSTQWQTSAILVNPPSLAVIACTVLAELHGRMGYFPGIVRLRPMANSLPTRYELAEIVNLQAVRERARERR